MITIMVYSFRGCAYISNSLLIRKGNIVYYSSELNVGEKILDEHIVYLHMGRVYLHMDDLQGELQLIVRRI